MTDEEAAALIELQHGIRDLEAAHCKADEILVSVLRGLGYDKTCDAWEKVGGWYA